MSPTGTNKVTISPPERERGTAPNILPKIVFLQKLNILQGVLQML